MGNKFRVWYEVKDLADYKVEIEANYALVGPDGSLVLYDDWIERLDQCWLDVVAGFAPGDWQRFKKLGEKDKDDNDN